jgi:hypothetical protein
LAPLVDGIRGQTSIEQIIVTSLAEYSAAAAPPQIAGTVFLASLLTPVVVSDLPAVRSSPTISR